MTKIFLRYIWSYYSSEPIAPKTFRIFWADRAQSDLCYNVCPSTKCCMIGYLDIYTISFPSQLGIC